MYKRKMLLIVVAGILVLAANNSYSNPELLQELHSQINKSYNSLSSFTADFTQRNVWSFNEDEMISSGRIYLEGEKFALIYEQPAGQRIIIDEKVYVIDDSEKTVLITSFENNLSPVGVINHFWDISAVSLIKDTDEMYLIQLMPENDPDIKRIVVFVDKKDFFVTDINYEDNDANRVEYSFSGFVKNRLLDKKAFEIPSFTGYSVIDQTSN